MKKTITIILLIIVVIWLGFEVVNYPNFVSDVDNHKILRAEYPGITVSGPRYLPLFMKGFYHLFPSLYEPTV